MCMYVCIFYVCMCIFVAKSYTKSAHVRFAFMFFYLSASTYLYLCTEKRERERKSKTTSRQTDLPQPVQCRSFGLCVREDLKGYKAQYASVMSANDSS